MTAFLLGSAPADLAAPWAAAPSRCPQLRLALFTDAFAPDTNGVARTIERLVDAVQARGGHVRVFAPGDGGDAGPAVGVHRCGGRPCWAYPQLRLAVPRRRALMAELRAWEPTLVHAATPFGVGLAGRAAARALGIPLVTSYQTSFSAYATYYGLAPLAGLGWHYLRWFHNAGARTLCPSRAVQTELAARGFHRTGVCGRGVDADHFHPRHRSDALRARLGADDDTILVAYVGRFARANGLDVLLAAARRVAAATTRPVVFAFAGDGPYAAACRRAAPAGAVFTGQLHGAELARLYASADLLAFPSTTDSSGDVLLEAMASGVPVVAADAGPTRELLGDGRGAIVGGGNTIVLADRIHSLIDDPDARASFARRALAEARDRSWDALFDRLVADYAQVSAAGDLSASARSGPRSPWARTTARRAAGAARPETLWR